MTPLPADALFRLLGWFPALRRLTVAARARLVDRLAGHPRAVEFANDLLKDAFARWSRLHGEWRPTADLDREWTQLVEPALPSTSALSPLVLAVLVWHVCPAGHPVADPTLNELEVACVKPSGVSVALSV